MKRALEMALEILSITFKYKHHAETNIQNNLPNESTNIQ
jgi:hypothetical protein